MSETVIKVENLSKQYRLGEVGTGSLAHDVHRWIARIKGKEDPYLKIGESNDRTKKGSSEYVWALSNINFDVKRGEVLGIIGRNGAGKSTLLKILSQTTAPTKGSVKIRGRVASLLEVGTGFHPELTGKENIYLNGAILGMSKKEITNKFDEIVDFAGVERYIHTPVKRYSSGMYVRLAFAVAAHLEPDILIIDEVLAVGDAEFQEKCIGKIRNVSKTDGRTVFFVSHNLSTISSLCNKAMLLEKGMLIQHGFPADVLSTYTQRHHAEDCFDYTNLQINNGQTEVFIRKVNLKTSGYIQDEIILTAGITINKPLGDLVFGLNILNRGLTPIFRSNHNDFEPSQKWQPGEYELSIRVPKSMLAVGEYIFDLDLAIPYVKRFTTEEMKLKVSLQSRNELGDAYFLRNDPNYMEVVRTSVAHTIERLNGLTK